MRTQQANWQYIAEYKAQVEAIIAQQLADLQNNVILLHPVNDRLKHDLTAYTTQLSAAYLSMPVAVRA
ncbi:MAG TPA: hypothetical protein VK167_05225 [Flavipsychrobacter sp.]|nr:hypothetical protein [Flavipsychrobacter sp.]